MAGCPDKSQLDQYAAASLSASESAQVQTHIDGCDACRTSYDRMKDTLADIAPAAKSPSNVTVSVDESARSSPSARVAAALPSVPGYKITGVLGQGGMGTVYRAIQDKLNRAVALKVLHAVVATASPTAVARFRREASAAARLHHTNIIPIYDYGESLDGYFYAMELIEGRPLDVLIQRFAEQDAATASPARLAELLQSQTVELSRAEFRSDASHGRMERQDTASVPSVGGRGRIYYHQVARWIADAADGLDYAHGQGIIHRDVKPANLILSIDGRIMIADFGLAKSEADASVTKTGTLMGTLRYMSPEQAMAKRVRLDHRTDIYSLGATMYELLCFQPVVAGADEKEILGAIISRDPIAPRKHSHRVPQDLDTICLKCLEKSPAARYATAGELADDLRRFLAGHVIAAKPPGPMRRIGKFAKRRRALSISIVSAALLAASSSIVVWERAARREAESIQRVEADRRRGQAVLALYESGMFFAYANKWEPAATEFARALTRDPNHVKTLLGVAWMHLQRNRLDPEQAGTDALERTVQLCGRALEVMPDEVSALNYRGVAFRRLGRLDESILDLHRAAELEPSRYEVWTNLGTSYAITGAFEQSLTCLREGARLAGHGDDTKDVYHAGTWRNLAVLEGHMGLPEALEHVAYAIECDRTDVLAWVTRARIQLQRGTEDGLADAADCARVADRQANQLHPQAKRLRALTHLSEGLFEQAANHARLAIQLGDMATINHLIIAVARASRHDAEAAREQLGAAKSQWPNNLREEGDAYASMKSNKLWIDSAAELLALRQEAESLLSSPRP